MRNEAMGKGIGWQCEALGLDPFGEGKTHAVHIWKYILICKIYLTHE